MKNPLRERTPAEEHAMAKVSALYTVNRLGYATLADVMREQGLCEIRAKKALEDLVKDGQIHRTGNTYMSFQCPNE